MLKHSLKAGQRIAYYTLGRNVKEVLLDHDYRENEHPFFVLDTTSLAGATANEDLWSAGQWRLVEPARKVLARHLFKTPKTVKAGLRAWGPGEVERETALAESLLRRTQREWPYGHRMHGHPAFDAAGLHIGWDLSWERVED